jgi:hypothetical protein
MSTRLRVQEDDAGMALISAILVTMVVTLLAISAIAMANSSLNSTVVNRKQVQSIGAAEAGINLAINGLQSATPPCSASGTLSSGPTNSSYSVAITYYSTFPPSGDPLPCSAVQAGTSIPMAAQLRSTGDTVAKGFGSRVMSALVQMNPVPSAAFDKAIFAQGNLTFNNKSTINGDGKNNANVYTNSSFTCTNNEYFYGFLYSQGDITGSNTCGGTGDWWAAGRISATGNGVLGGSVYAAGCNDTTKGCASNASTSGNISLSSNYSVAKNAIAKGTISPTPCGAGRVILGNCVTNASQGPPPYQPFPTVDFNSLAWTNAGYTNQINEGSNCTQLQLDLVAMATVTTKTVITTSCNVDWGGATWLFNTDVAVFATGGFGSSHAVSFQSTTSAAHYLYMIVPTHLIGSQTATPCSSNTGNIKFTNQTSINSTNNPLASFIYTPCAVTFNNNQTEVGQVYGGGTVTITNQFNMNFDSIPVPGAIGGTGGPPTAYSIALSYIREG